MGEKLFNLILFLKGRFWQKQKINADFMKKKNLLWTVKQRTSIWNIFLNILRCFLCKLRALFQRC